MVLWSFIYYGKKLWYYTENYGTLIYEVKTMVLYDKTMKLRFTVEKIWYFTETVEFFKQL